MRPLPVAALPSSSTSGVRNSPVFEREALLERLAKAGLEVLRLDCTDDRARFAEACDRPFDAVIAGGGPAGLATAKALVARGLRTLVLERGLFLETSKTWALPDTVVDRNGLRDAVARQHSDTWFRDYFGLAYPSRIDYCIMDQPKLLFLMAEQILSGKGELVVAENAEVTAFARTGPDGALDVKGIANGYRLLRFHEALEHYPRAVSLAGVDDAFHRKYDPWVMVNTWDELDEIAKKAENFHVAARTLIDASGYKSNLVKSFHRQRSSYAWKCLIYEFEEIEPQPEIIWDLALPTETHANFWVDVSGDASAGIGVMVLTQADANFPMAHPSKRDLEDYMSRWLNVRRISGKFVRERFGMIPMTDFVEPATYERILFVGASATRQIPNTGFGIQPCIEEGELAGKVIAEALAKGDLSQASLRSFDYAWLRRNEFRASIDLFQQDFHFAYTCDEYFHEFSACCTSVPPHVVKERLLDDVDAHHLHVLAGMFLKNTQLLDRNRFHDEWIAPLSRDMGRMVYVLLAQCFGGYVPSLHPMFRKDGSGRSLLRGLGVWTARLALREAPEAMLSFLCRQLFHAPVLRLAAAARPVLLTVITLLAKLHDRRTKR